MALRQTRLDYRKLTNSMCLMVESEASLLQIVEESTRSQNGEHRSDLDRRLAATWMPWMCKIVMFNCHDLKKFFPPSFATRSGLLAIFLCLKSNDWTRVKIEVSLARAMV